MAWKPADHRLADKDVVAVADLADIAPNQVCLAWDNARDSALVREYAEIARAGETDS
jgi:hypothetical protein